MAMALQFEDVRSDARQPSSAPLLAGCAMPRSEDEDNGSAAHHDVLKIGAEVTDKVPRLSSTNLWIVQHGRWCIEDDQGRFGAFDLTCKAADQGRILMCCEPAGHMQVLQVPRPSSEAAQVGYHPPRVKSACPVHPMNSTSRGEGHADPCFDQRSSRPPVPSFGKDEMNAWTAWTHLPCWANVHGQQGHDFTRPWASEEAFDLPSVDPSCEVNP